MRWLLGIGVLFAVFAVANWWIVLRPLSRIDAALDTEQNALDTSNDQAVAATKARHPSARGVCAICGRAHPGSYRETPWAP